LLLCRLLTILSHTTWKILLHHLRLLLLGFRGLFHVLDNIIFYQISAHFKILNRLLQF
jgi:hypothetical protein